MSLECTSTGSSLKESSCCWKTKLTWQVKYGSPLTATIFYADLKHLLGTYYYPLWHFKYSNLEVFWSFIDGDHDHYHIEGLMESPTVDDDGDCFSPLLLNATSVNIEVYYNKAVNYTLMVTFVSFICHPFSLLMQSHRPVLAGFLNCLLLGLLPSSPSVNQTNGT